MHLNWMYTTLLSITLFAIQASAQYPTTTTDYYTYSTPTPPYQPPTYSTCIPITVTTAITTIVTSVTTTTLTITSPGTYGYSGYDTYDTSTYLPPLRKKNALIIGLVVGLCGLAIILLIAFLLYRRKRKAKVLKYGESTTTYAAASS